MGKRYLSAIRATVRQFLKDEFQESIDPEFPDDELDLHVSECLIDISKVCPYEVKETVESDGTKEIDISDVEDLIGEKVVKVEYPAGNDPPSFQQFTKFGDTLRLTDTTPTSGEDIYLYCHEVHQLTESSSTLGPDLEKVLIDGVVAMTAMAFLNKMRDQIVPSSYQLYATWAALKEGDYKAGLRDIAKTNVWQF
jgi:hypothetical protein